MTKQARNIFLDWASTRPHAHQKVLNIAILDSQEKGEIIDASVAKEILGVVESIIKEKATPSQV